ncbi:MULTISPECIES: MBL fold metallo-hydrolase [unclassified Lysobacter]|uniref:MBL fold metallo-hydrolase n=1 Tax=unclassified Lysobacter TaxID=2635362 RepID=UPI0006F25023|nr:MULTISPECIES: MBL fold metallo-hydrolase [unclassified Lysobacter]KQZ60341.1 MBL fold metallo-hydrolase [Lysobacter sp. Root559]KRA76786.1 MBL fold metallo-hydrolase [Lysobacter sp. Root667]KRC38782.1 MBL fold metallo-hydrolase [Lysobacter sp. Root76]KRD71014.1 MBL fold metallo-hydrolase [Lysobacter sp. Root96]
MSPQVQSFHHADTGTWSYLVVDPATSQAAIVDPVLDYDARSGRTGGNSAQAILDAAQACGADVRWLLETHAHADHLTAAHWLKQRLPQARIAIGRRIREVQRTFVPVLGLDAKVEADGSQFDHLFEDEETFAIGELRARAIAVPGHTLDSLAYLIDDALFAGDSLFMPDSGTARCDFPGGDAAMLYASIRHLYELPDATRVFVCHDYGPDGRAPRCETSIGEQKRANIHLRDDTVEAEFVRMREARDATLAVPALILPALQVNLRAGALPEAEDNGVRYLKIPLNQL